MIGTRTRMVILLAIPLALALFLILGLLPFQERSVGAAAVSRLTGLDLPSEASIAHSVYQPLPRGYLLAQIEMPYDRIQRFREQELLIERVWLPLSEQHLLPDVIYSVDWWQPSALERPQVTSFRLPPDGRLVSVAVPDRPSQDSVVYIWSIRD